MGRPVTAEREIAIARLLEREIAKTHLDEWLERHGADIRKRAVRNAVKTYYGAWGGQLDDEQLCRGRPNRVVHEDWMRKWHKDDKDRRAAWLARWVLSPEMQDGILPRANLLMLRRRLLSKVRDAARRASSDLCMVRISAKTASDLDHLAKQMRLPSRAAVVMALAKAAISGNVN